MIVENLNFNSVLRVKTIQQHFAILEENSHHRQNSASGFLNVNILFRLDYPILNFLKCHHGCYTDSGKLKNI